MKYQTKYWITFLLVFCVFCAFAQKENDKDKEKYNKITDSLTRIGQKDKIIPFFLNELKSKPKNEQVLRSLGYQYIENNQLDLGEKYYMQAIEVNPACARCYANIGRAYGEKNDYKKTLEFIEKAIIIDPKTAEFYILRGNSKEGLGNKAEASLDYNTAIELAPKSADTFIARASYNTRQGFSSSALNDLNKAVELAPKHHYCYFLRGIHYYDKKIFDKAFKDFDKAIKLDSTHYDAYARRGAIYDIQKDPKNALKDYTKALSLNKKDFFLYLNRSQVKYQLEDMDGSCADKQEAYAILKREDPKSPQKEEIEYSLGNFCDPTKASYYYQRGIAFYNLGQFEKGIEIYSVGVKKFPINAMMLSFRANAYTRVQKYTEAIKDYEAAIINKSNFIDDILANQRHTGLRNADVASSVDGWMISNYISIAESQFGLGKYDEALVAINKGIELAPKTSNEAVGKDNCYKIRGDIYLSLEKYKEAISDFDKSIALNNTVVISYVSRAVAKINLTEKMKMSISVGYYNQGFSPNWILPALTRKADQNMLSALDDCDRAIKIAPKQGYAYFIRGQIKRMLGQKDYCYDFVMAKQLNYPIPAEMLDKCK